MWETRVRFLGWEDLLEENRATHSSILAWRIPMEKSLGGYSTWGHKESDTTEQPSTAQSDTKPLFLGVYLKQEPV